MKVRVSVLVAGRGKGVRRSEQPLSKQLKQRVAVRTPIFLLSFTDSSNDEEARRPLLPLDIRCLIVYHVLSEKKEYEELGGNSFDEWGRQAVQKRLVRRLEKLGYEVTLAPTSPV